MKVYSSIHLSTLGTTAESLNYSNKIMVLWDVQSGANALADPAVSIFRGDGASRFLQSIGTRLHGVTSYKSIILSWHNLGTIPAFAWRD
jgi:hypothetical protein